MEETRKPRWWGPRPTLQEITDQSIERFKARLEALFPKPKRTRRRKSEAEVP